ncbi:MAG TPA: hypothetical protein VNF50_13705 [Acidimicrobiales bacterium]|nr:hypothetical protein [Acidimicrobiales bacterium]
MSPPVPADQPSAVILKMVADRYAHGRLAAARTLGRMGVPVVATAESRWNPEVLSRFVKRTVVLPMSQSPGDAELSLLLDLAGELADRPVLLATDDMSTLFVEDHAEVLATRFRFPGQPAGLARSLADKGQLYEMCLRTGTPTPSVSFPKSRDEAAGFAVATTYPVVVKSMDPQVMRTRPAATSVLIAEDEASLLAAYDLMEDPARPNLMFQEYIPGDPQSVWMFDGYFDAGSRCLVGFTGQKLRQHPPTTGATSLGICTLNPAVHALACEFLGGIGYRGIVDMGFRYDGRDGQYKLLDVNPRMGATFRLFVGEAGTDVVEAMYRDMTGLPVREDRGVEGRRWVVEPSDIWTYGLEKKAGQLTTREWLRSLRGVDERAWVARDDPLPPAGVAALMALQTTRRRLRRTSSPT